MIDDSEPRRPRPKGNAAQQARGMAKNPVRHAVLRLLNDPNGPRTIDTITESSGFTRRKVIYAINWLVDNLYISPAWGINDDGRRALDFVEVREKGPQ